MSGYNRSCSRADSSILLVAQCAAALSMMPASAPSCWAQGVTAASYNEYAIWVSPSGGILWERLGEARSFCHRPIPYRILCLSRGGIEESDHGHRRLPRAYHQRPRRRAAEQRDELAALHSITSSARASTLSGNARPRV